MVDIGNQNRCRGDGDSQLKINNNKININNYKVIIYTGVLAAHYILYVYYNHIPIEIGKGYR